MAQVAEYKQFSPNSHEESFNTKIGFALRTLERSLNSEPVLL